MSNECLITHVVISHHSIQHPILQPMEPLQRLQLTDCFPSAQQPLWQRQQLRHCVPTRTKLLHEDQLHQRNTTSLAAVQSLKIKSVSIYVRHWVERVMNSGAPQHRSAEHWFSFFLLMLLLLLARSRCCWIWHWGHCLSISFLVWWEMHKATW